MPPQPRRLANLVYPVFRHGLVLKEQSFAQSGTLMQTAYYLKYVPILGKFIPVEQLFIDEFEKGNRTRLAIADIAAKPLKDDLFTKAYLENLAK